MSLFSKAFHSPDVFLAGLSFALCSFGGSFLCRSLGKGNLKQTTIACTRCSCLSEIGDFRFEYEYENDFSILVCTFHIITTQTHLIP